MKHNLFRIALEAAQFTEWVGFDLDGTIAIDDGWKGPEHIGAPIPEMIAKIKAYRAEGVECRIMTARVGHENPEENDKARHYINLWTQEHVGEVLPVTNEKDPGMLRLYDDKAEKVIKNTGVVA